MITPTGTGSIALSPGLPIIACLWLLAPLLARSVLWGSDLDISVKLISKRINTIYNY